MAVPMTTIVDLLSKNLLILECGHWMRHTGTRSPEPGDLIICPACNVPERRPAHDANTAPAGLFKKGEYFG